MLVCFVFCNWIELVISDTGTLLPNTVELVFLSTHLALTLHQNANFIWPYHYYAQICVVQKHQINFDMIFAVDWSFE